MRRMDNLDTSVRLLQLEFGQHRGLVGRFGAHLLANWDQCSSFLVGFLEKDEFRIYSRKNFKQKNVIGAKFVNTPVNIAACRL